MTYRGRWVVLVLFLLLASIAVPAAADKVVISTVHGPVTIQLLGEHAPKTVANFIKLAREGFYDGLTFHRVEPGVLVQGGDPRGNGTGGPGYTVEAEIDPQLHHRVGTVATARLGDRANPERRSSGSQFYICLQPLPYLDGAYTIFGQVVEGLDVAARIQRGDRMTKVEVLEESP